MKRHPESELRLAEFLKNLKARGTNLATVATATEIAGSTLSDWSQGRVPTDHDALRRLAKHFGVTLEQLLFGEKTLGASDTATLQYEDFFGGKFEVELKVRRIREQSKNVGKSSKPEGDDK